MTLFGIAALLAPGRRADARRLHHRQLRLALDLLPQRAGRPARAVSCAAPSWSIPDYLKAERADARRQRQPFDTLGLCLLSVTMVCWEIVLSKGQEWDWLGDPFCRVQTLLVLFVVCLVGADLPRAADRQSADQLPHAGATATSAPAASSSSAPSACCTPTPPRCPALLQSLFGYDATTSGLVLSPAGRLRGHRCCSSSAILLGRGRRRPLSDGGRAADAGGRQLLDVAAEPGHQPLAGGLAARGGDRRACRCSSRR